jgi:hypothetical protein
MHCRIYVLNNQQLSTEHTQRQSISVTLVPSHLTFWLYMCTYV